MTLIGINVCIEIVKGQLGICALDEILEANEMVCLPLEDKDQPEYKIAQFKAFAVDSMTRC